MHQRVRAKRDSLTEEPLELHLALGTPMVNPLAWNSDYAAS
jgi:hypothetical protein